MIDTSHKKSKVYVSLRMSDSILAEIDKLAEKNGRNRSQEIIFALRKYVETNDNNMHEELTHKTEYPVVITPKITSGVKEELLSLLYDKDIKEKIKKISNE